MELLGIYYVNVTALKKIDILALEITHKRTVTPNKCRKVWMLIVHVAH